MSKGRPAKLVNSKALQTAFKAAHGHTKQNEAVAAITAAYCELDQKVSTGWVYVQLKAAGLLDKLPKGAKGRIKGQVVARRTAPRALPTTRQEVVKPENIIVVPDAFVDAPADNYIARAGQCGMNPVWVDYLNKDRVD